MTEHSGEDRELDALWERARRGGDPRVLDEFFRRLAEPAYALALAVTRRPAAAEDVVQDAFLRILRERGRFRPGARVWPWAAQVVYRAALDYRRGERRLAEREEVAMRTAGAVSAEAQRAEREEQLALVRRAFEELPEDERLPIALHLLQGLTQAEAAAVLEVPARTLSHRVESGLERLRRAVAGSGAALGAAAAGNALGLLSEATAVSAPPRLLEAVSRLATAAHSRAAAGSASATRKGGLAMKVVLGVVLAGALAGIVGLMGRTGPTNASAPPAPAGPPKHEHVASVNVRTECGDELDGPAKEAIGFHGGMPDAEGNLWGGRWLRASDGRILRLGSCDHGSLGFSLPEGPIAGKPVRYEAGGYGWWCGGSAMVGRPDAGGKTDGIYESTGRDGKLIRIWKNQEKGGRWWFARAAGGGGAAAPKAKGQSADALAVKFGWLNEPQVGLDGKLRFMAEGAFYVLEDGKVTCVLGPDDYKAATEVMKGAMPNQGYVGGDGTIYLGYYYASDAAYRGQQAAVWRVTADGKVEPWARSSGNSAGDGDTLKQAGWFCGPHLGNYGVARFIPADAVLTSAHDEDFARRIQNGRTSVLCEDGEWREFTNDKRKGAVNACGMTIGPNGTIYHTGRHWTDTRLWRYTGLDFSKPTVSKREGGGK